MRLFLIRPDQRNRIDQALDIRKIVKKAQMFIKKTSQYTGNTSKQFKIYFAYYH